MTDTACIKTARVDIYQRVTDEIVKAIEAGAGPFIMPWHGMLWGRPRNAFTGEAYRGINTLVLWSATRNRKYVSSYWATYRQWQHLDAKVKAGEKATLVLLYKRHPVEAQDAKTGEPVEDYRLIVRAYFVFNAQQVEGWDEPKPQLPDLVAANEAAENFIAATGAEIRTGDAALYLRASDYITMPARNRFVGTATSSPTECYYSTIFHELVHWTGHWMRMSRNLSGPFGTADYAMEELIAELGAAFLCAEFFVLHVPRKDHAAYIDQWLDVLKGDKRAIFTASREAHRAVEFLLSS